MPLLDNILESEISCSQGSEEFEVYPPPKRFCSGLSDIESEINCNQNHEESLCWENWTCIELAEQLEEVGLEDVAEKFRGMF